MRHAHRGWVEPGYAAPLGVSGHAFAAGWVLDAFLFLLLLLVR